MRIPDLRAKSDRIELDRVTLLVAYIQVFFDKVYGTDFDINNWDAVRIQTELEELFDPEDFDRLFLTEFGKGVIVGAWAQTFILGKEDTDDES